MSNRVIVAFANRKAVKVSKWKVEVGQTVYHGRALLLYEDNENGGVSKLKSKCVGTVVSLIAKEGEILNPGDPVLEVEEGCSHPTVINDLCAECGADLQREGVSESNATVPMVHHIPQLKVSQQEAEMIGKADTDRLLKDRKLVLLVDLDQTLIHTTHDNIPNNIKDVHHFQLGTSAWYHTRLRPNTAHFLKEMNSYFELHICTFGVRPYAHMVANILDRDHSLFSNRILSRDECFNFNSKVANLQALFPNGDELVCIIDDRKDVWNNSPNLIPVKPYVFFTNTGDINDPNLPPITKHSEFFAKGVKLKKMETEGEVKEGVHDEFYVEDEDDYLLYLETILKKVHDLFYLIYDKKQAGEPHVRSVLEQLRGSVLKGCEIVFSGLVPLHEGLEHSEPYLMARDLGAKIGKSVCDTTTHIVAAREGTAKLHESKKFPNIKIVNPQWLTTCLYRWEQVDERLFPLVKNKDCKKGKDDELPLALTLDDVMLMQQEVQAEFNSDSSDTVIAAVDVVKPPVDNLSGDNSDSNHVQSVANRDNLETAKKANKEKGHCEKSILKTAKKDEVLKGDNGNSLRDRVKCKATSENAKSEKHSMRDCPQGPVSNSHPSGGLLKKDQLKPVILDFLKPNKSTDAIMKFQIPKKVCFDDNPEIEIFDNTSALLTKKSSPKKKKRKVIEEARHLSSELEYDTFLKKNEQLLKLNLKHMESAQKILEDKYLSQSRLAYEEFQMKFKQSQEEHQAKMQHLNEEAQLLIKNEMEKHNLNLQNLSEEQSNKMARCNNEHMHRINLMNEEHKVKIKLMYAVHTAKMKQLVKKRKVSPEDTE